MQFSGFFSNWMFPEMRRFSKSALAKKLTDGERYSCSATLLRWPFSVIIVSNLLIFEGWELGSFDTHYMQRSGIFSRFFLYSFLPWRKHFLKSECDVTVFWCPDNNLIGKKTEERAAKNVWDVLRYRIVKKTAFDFFGNVVSVVPTILCAIVLMIFAQTFPKILGPFTGNKTQNFQKDVEYVPKMSAALIFSLVVTKENCFENFLRSLYLEQYVFFE